VSARHALARVERVDAVVHAAARLPRSFDDLEAAAANRALDEAVFAQARQWRATIVYLSSVSLYPDRERARWSERDGIDPVGAYQKEKAWAEDQGRALVQETGQSFTALRLSAPYGFGQRARTVISLFIEQALAGGPITYWGSGRREQDFVYADDAGAACAAAVVGPGGTFNVAGGSSVSMRSLAEVVAEQAGLPAEAVRPAGREDPQEHVRVAYDITSIADACGWRPQTSLAEGLSLYLAAGAKAASE
jgi:UDP-glucose 4-epimerase